MLCYVNMLNGPWTLEERGIPHQQPISCVCRRGRVPGLNLRGFLNVAVFQAARDETPANCIQKNGCQRLTLAAQRRVDSG